MSSLKVNVSLQSFQVPPGVSLHTRNRTYSPYAGRELLWISLLDLLEPHPRTLTSPLRVHSPFQTT
jgi:hypothetical protein